MEAGVDGLLHDKTRKPGKPPGETTHWTSRAMAKAMGLAVSKRRAEQRQRIPLFPRPGILLRCRIISATGFRVERSSSR
jgi:hypothetical protein